MAYIKFTAEQINREQNRRRKDYDGMKVRQAISDICKDLMDYSQNSLDTSRKIRWSSLPALSETEKLQVVEGLREYGYYVTVRKNDINISWTSD